MALDEPKDNDQIFTIDGFTYAIDKGLLESVQPVTIDFKSIGFHITATMSPALNRSCSGH